MFKIDLKYVFLAILIFVVLFVIGWFAYQYHITKLELYKIKYKQLQEKVEFLEVENKHYQASVKVVDEEKIAKLVEERVSKKFKEIIKKEKIVSTGEGSATIPVITGKTTIINSECSNLHFENQDLKFDGIFDLTKKEWNVNYEIKPIPIKFNYIVTEKKTDKIPVKKVFVEAVNSRTNQKLAFTEFEVMFTNKYNKEDLKIPFYKSKTFKVNLAIGCLLTAILLKR